MVSHKEIKNYWEDKSPGRKHSDKEVGSKEFYDEIEHSRYSDYFKYKYLPKVAEFDQHANEKVLEIGVGLGTDSLQFAKNGAKSHGIDLTETAIKLTKERFAMNGLKGTFKSASFTNIPFEDNTFDLVYSFGVLHHSEETQEGIDEVYRVLKPGGKAIIMLYHKGFKYYVRKLFLYGVLKMEFINHTAQEIVSKHSEEFNDCPLTKAYSRKECDPMFDKYKDVTYECYKIDDYIYINKKMFSLISFILPEKSVQWLENKWGWNIIIKGYK